MGHLDHCCGQYLLKTIRKAKKKKVLLSQISPPGYTAQLCILYYILLYEDTRLSSGRSTTATPGRPAPLRFTSNTPYTHDSDNTPITPNSIHTSDTSDITNITIPNILKTTNTFHTPNITSTPNTPYIPNTLTLKTPLTLLKFKALLAYKYY